MFGGPKVEALSLGDIILKKSFRITREEAEVGDPTILMAAILEEAGSEEHARSIFRSLKRMGTDPSILSYEMTLETRSSRLGGAVSSAWRVSADRGTTSVPDTPR
jgi:hypothetical protein